MMIALTVQKLLWRLVEWTWPARWPMQEKRRRGGLCIVEYHRDINDRSNLSCRRCTTWERRAGDPVLGERSR
jgi:hypothetical protein